MTRDKEKSENVCGICIHHKKAKIHVQYVTDTVPDVIFKYLD